MREDLVVSARRAGRGAVLSGRWLAETVLDLAPRLPVRDVETLVAHHEGLTGDELAASLIQAAGRVSAGIAATTGGVIAAQELSIAGLVLVPFELAAETALVVGTELKLVAELHHVAGRSLPRGPRAGAESAVVAWMSARAIPPTPVAAVVRGDVLGRAGRHHLRGTLRKRYTRNLTTLAPLMTGAAAAGYINRRATLDVGSKIARDLGLRA